MNGQAQAPVHPASQNAYYRENAALANAQAQQAQAQAGQALAQRDVMAAQAAQQGLGQPQQAQQVSPQEQAQQMASGLLDGSIPRDQFIMAMQEGQVNPELGAAALQMADQYAGQAQQPAGLGAI